MHIEIKLDPSCKIPKIIILSDKITDEIEALAKKLSDKEPRIIAGMQNSEMKILDPKTLIRIYANSKKVMAVTQSGEYTLRLRLYELEESLDPHQFVRISNSEIINLKKVAGFDLSFTGTICVKLSDGAVTYVSRRYVAKIKHILGMR